MQRRALAGTATLIMYASMNPTVEASTVAATRATPAGLRSATTPSGAGPAGTVAAICLCSMRASTTAG